MSHQDDGKQSSDDDYQDRKQFPREPVRKMSKPRAVGMAACYFRRLRAEQLRRGRCAAGKAESVTRRAGAGADARVTRMVVLLSRTTCPDVGWVRNASTRPGRRVAAAGSNCLPDERETQ